MRLVDVHVQRFRNVLDSTVIPIDEQVTCLVGKNESGKTTLLHALWRLNPHVPTSFETTHDYPRWRLVADRKAKAINDVAPVTAGFELDAGDVAAVEALVGLGVAGSIVTFSRRYDGELLCDCDTDDVAAVKSVLQGHELPDLVGRQLEGSPDLTSLREATAGLLQTESESEVPNDELVEMLRAIEASIAAILTNGEDLNAAVSRLLIGRLPRFFYFSDYQMLPGRVDLTALSSTDELPAMSSNQTARALLALASTDVASLGNDAYEDRKAELEAVGGDLSQQVSEYWRQNPELTVEFDVDKMTRQHPNGQTAVAQYLDIRVRDGRHGSFTNNFDQRSSGFRWFFSFLAAFSEFEQEASGVIVLLDEPALSLHGRAQADFLRFIDMRLAATCQVIYTTHSPFMVDVAHLERVRVVEDRGRDAGAIASTEVLGVDADTLFPLQGALGYEIAQSLFIGPANLLVEGTSDFTYLTVISDHLRALERPAMDIRWRILPAGGSANVPAFVALIGPKLDVTVLVDAGAQGMQRLVSMVSQGLLTSDRLLTIASITATKHADIEDVFDSSDYLRLYNGAFGTELTASNLPAGDRIIDRISRASGQPFTDHGLPADWLLRHRDTVLDGLSPATLDRFEALFTMINATLAK